MKHVIVYVMLIILVSSINSCKDTSPVNPVKPKDSVDIKPIDPCSGKTKPFRADFTIYEGSPNVDTLIASDTILSYTSSYIGNCFALFRANGNYTSYEWQVGDDPRTFTRKEHSLKFNGEVEGRYRVRLIARDTNWAKCVPGDDGTDTVYKTLTITPHYNARIFGRYRGYCLHNPKDTFTFELRMHQINYTSDRDSAALMFNFPNGAQGIRYEVFNNGRDSVIKKRMGITLLNRAFAFSYFGIALGGNQAQGTATLSPDGNTIAIRYNEFEPTIPWPNNWMIGRQFIGKRIP